MRKIVQDPYESEKIESNLILKEGDTLVATFDIEKELGIEIVGETKVKIAVEEDEEPWDDIIDEADDKVMDDIDKNVNEEYIK